MEDANGGLSVPAIGRKIKIVSGYAGWRMGGSWEKGTGNNTVVPGFISGFQYLKRRNNRGCDEHIGKTLRKTLGFQQGIFNEVLI